MSTSLKSRIKEILMVSVAIPSVLYFIFVVLQAPASAATLQYQVTHDELLSAVTNYLDSNETYSKIPHRVYTKRMMDTVLSDQEIVIQITDRVRGPLLKSDNFQVVITSGGRTIRRFELRGLIGIEVPVAIAVRDLKRGDGVTGSYEFAFRDLSGTPVRNPIYEGDNTGDEVVKVSVRAGREIDRNLLESPDLVARGERVIVFFDKSGLSLTMIGQALESGKLGDSIRILNEASKKMIVCEVTGDGEVEAK